METKEAIELLKTELVKVKAGGTTDISIGVLEAYLDQLGSHATQSMENMRLAHTASLAQYDAKNAQARDMFNSVIDAGKDAINSAIIINGGAGVVIMAFLGNAISKTDNAELLLKLTNPLLYFGLGVFFGSLSFGVRYVTQFLYAGQWLKVGHVFNALAWLAVIASLSVFSCGMLSTYQGFYTEYAHRIVPPSVK